MRSVRHGPSLAPIDSPGGRTSNAPTALRRIARDKVAMTCVAVIGLIALGAISAGWVEHLLGWGQATQDREWGVSIDGLPVAPSGRHPLGTDALGRDVLVRTLYGARVSLLVGLTAAAGSVVIGVAVGMLAGYHRGRIDAALSRAIDVVLAFPFLLFALAIVSVAGPSLWMVIGVIIFFSWAAVARIVRGETLAICEGKYVEAARSMGSGATRVMLVEVLPNLVAPVLVYATFLIPVSIVFEATLSYLGMGLVPPAASWGKMLADAQQYYEVAPWLLLAPGVALMATTISFNVLGDRLRDALDPVGSRPNRSAESSR